MISTSFGSIITKEMHMRLIRSLISWRRRRPRLLLRSVCIGGSIAFWGCLGKAAGRIMGVTASMESQLAMAGAALGAILGGTLSLVIAKKRRDV